MVRIRRDDPLSSVALSQVDAGMSTGNTLAAAGSSNGSDSAIDPMVDALMQMGFKRGKTHFLTTHFRLQKLSSPSHPLSPWGGNPPKATKLFTSGAHLFLH